MVQKMLWDLFNSTLTFCGEIIIGIRFIEVIFYIVDLLLMPIIVYSLYRTEVCPESAFSGNFNVPEHAQ